MQIAANKKTSHPLWLKYVFLMLVLLFIYVGNRQLQTWLGERAFEKTSLASLPIEVALAKANLEDKPVLLNISAAWCPSCRKLDSQVFNNADVYQYIQQNTVFTRIEYDSEQGMALMQKYSVFGFPTLLILDGEGDKISHLPLTYEPQQFLRQLASVASLN